MNRGSFSRYLPGSPLMRAWGVTVTGGGVQRVGAGEVYPPAGHPSDHVFRWADGRVLGALQLVLIKEGGGWFEGRAGAPERVEAGDVLVLPRQAWHRYRPDERTGWEEWWIELEGAVVETLEAEGPLGGEARRVRAAHGAQVEVRLEEIYDRLRGEAVSSHDPVRGALGLQVLAEVLEASDRTAGGALNASQEWIKQAEHLLAADLQSPPTGEEVAKHVGVSYTHFRREFRRATGLSPYRYVLRLRLAVARRTLGAGRQPLDQLAERLGFASAFHLSAAFKREFGEAPRAWRDRVQGRRPRRT